MPLVITKSALHLSQLAFSNFALYSVCDEHLKQLQGSLAKPRLQWDLNDLVTVHLLELHSIYSVPTELRGDQSVQSSSLILVRAHLGVKGLKFP